MSPAEHIFQRPQVANHRRLHYSRSLRDTYPSAGFCITRLRSRRQPATDAGRVTTVIGVEEPQGSSCHGYGVLVCVVVR